MFWPFRMQISNAFSSRGDTLSLSINLACSNIYHHLPSPFPGEQFYKAITTAQIWKIKTVPCIFTAGYTYKLEWTCSFVKLRRHLKERYTILSGKPEMSMDSPTSMRSNIYLPTLQANCATICQVRKQTTPTRPYYFLFLRENQAKALTNQSTPFISKQKQLTSLHQG